MPEIVSGFIGGLLVYASVAKLTVGTKFSETLAWLPVPGRVRSIAAKTVITCELLLGVALIGGLLGDVVNFAAALLFALFGGVLMWAKATGVDAPCMCFGSTNEPIGWVSIARNVVLFVVALTPLALPDSSTNIPARVIGGTLFLLVVAIQSAAEALSWRRHAASGGTT